MKKKKILILGASGMLGFTLHNYLNNQNLFTIGIVRNKIFKKNIKNIIICKQLNLENIKKILIKHKPNYLINCVGIINHKIKKNLDEVFYINSILPHYLSQICLKKKITNIHISTDCVYDGKNGNYSEKNIPNALDIYGISKTFGEVNMPNSIVIRTSIVGHEINTKFGLLEWFLSQKQNKSVKGFNKAYFSGLTTLELSRIIKEYFINKKYSFNNLVHVGGPRINKYSLIKIIGEVYGRKTRIKKSNFLKVDKSLNSMLFRKLTGYKIKSWKNMIKENKQFYENIVKK